MPTCIFAAHAGPSGAKLGGVTKANYSRGFGRPDCRPHLYQRSTAERRAIQHFPGRTTPQLPQGWGEHWSSCRPRLGRARPVADRLQEGGQCFERTTGRVDHRPALQQLRVVVPAVWVSLCDCASSQPRHTRRHRCPRTVRRRGHVYGDQIVMSAVHL
jgi:hypothetical protein